MVNKTLTTQIKALEVQLAVLKAQVKRLSTQTPPHSFADLYGILSGKADSREKEIDFVQYRFEWEGTQERQRLHEELTSRYKLARDMAPASDSVLLLSATPHDGDPHAFHSLVELIDPFRFPNPEQIALSDLEPIMVRRSKADIRKEDGSPLFPPRWVETTAVTFTEDELHLYHRVTDYIRDGHRAATALKDTAVGFLMVLLQQRMVSSIAAIRKSLERRLIALEHPEAAELTQAELRELKEREDDEECRPAADLKS